MNSACLAQGSPHNILDRLAEQYGEARFLGYGQGPRSQTTVAGTGLESIPGRRNSPGGVSGAGDDLIVIQESAAG